VSYAGASGYDASSSQSCTVTVSPLAPGATALSLSCPTTSGTPGTPIDLIGNLAPPLGGRTVTIKVSGTDSSSSTTTTHTDGSYAFTYTPSTTGTYTFAASFAGEPGYLSSSSPPCTVTVVIP
jgi:hypothetical protein